MGSRTAIVAAVFGCLSLSAASLAVVNPFTETFDSAAANWSSASAPFTPLSYFASGGPDGSAYGSRDFSFANSVAGDTPILFRGQSNFSSSGNAFVGNWVTSGVTSFTFSVRHNASFAIDFFARFSPAAGAGIVAVAGPSVQPNTWTTFTIPINAATPFIFESFPAPTFEAAFSNIARVQVGALVGATQAGVTPSFTFDIDNVGIAPTPGAAGLLGLSALGVLRRRR